MMPSGHKAFLVNNVNDVELLLMHNRTHAAEYVCPFATLAKHQEPRISLSVPERTPSC